MNQVYESGLWKKRLLLGCGMLLALAGIFLSAYSVDHHLHAKFQKHTDFACNINETFNCDHVINTPYSEVLGIPLGVWGLGFFVSMALLLVLALSKKSERSSMALQTYFAMSAIGVFVSIVYGSISWFILGGFCPTCLAIYTTTVLQAVVIGLCWKQIPRPLRVKSVAGGGAASGLAVLVVVGIFKLIEPQLIPVAVSSEKSQPFATAVHEIEKIPDLSFSPTALKIKIYKNKHEGAGEDYHKGNEKSKTVIVEFSDLECPGCAQAAKYLKKIYEKNKDKLFFVFKNYPLDEKCNPNIKRRFHDFACEAAVMARCAGEYGKFWEFHDNDIEHHNEMSSEKIIEWALNAGLSNMQIDICQAKTAAILTKIQHDIAEGDKYGVPATPTIFVDGHRFIGRSYVNLEDAIDKLLASPDEDIQSLISSSLDEIKEYIRSGKGVLVDVREQAEYDAKHLDGAILVPISRLQKLKRDEKLTELPAGKALFVYCATGERAELAARQVFEPLGFQATALQVPFEELVKDGF